ncbi:hypothetical protein [Pseudomonas fluorescens]
MSRALERSIFKTLTKAAVRDYTTFIGQAAIIRANLNVDQYPTFLKVYYDVGKKLKRRSWTGKQDIIDLGYDCAMEGKSLGEDISLAANWLVLHSKEINKFVVLTYEIQEDILNEDYLLALDKAEKFQKANGWSFWILEAIYYLFSKVHGSDAVRELAKEIKEQADNRIINFASTIFSERADDRYSVDNFFSRWSDVIPKHLKKPRLQNYYMFHALGVSDLGDSLGTVICQDFCNSIYDCYNTLVEAIFSVIFSKPESITDSMRVGINLLISSGISDFRLNKIKFLLADDPRSNNDLFVPNTEKFYKLLVEHSSTSDGLPEAVSFIHDLNENGASAIKSLRQLEKDSLRLRFLPVGLCLTDFSSNMFGKERKRITSQPWLALCNRNFTLEDLFVLPPNLAWAAINRISNFTDFDASRSASDLKAAYEGIITKDTRLEISNNAILWLGYELLDHGRTKECALIIELLNTKSSYWNRQATKLLLALLSQTCELEQAVELAYSKLDESKTSCFEYPFVNIFIDNGWADLKHLDPIRVAIVAHFTNSALENKDEEIHYACKMACKKINEIRKGKEILTEDLQSPNKKAVVTLFSDVWIEENLTFLSLKTSLEAMNERLGVLRLLVQVNPEGEHEYASEIMDITLRESQWEGLSHVDETRVFVNEAGVLRWAEKELRQDFETWKKAYALADVEEVTEKIFKFVNSSQEERMAEIANGELSEDNKILLAIIGRLENKFLNDPLDGLHCYLSARIRHGTIKNTILGPVDEAGFLAVGDRLDVSIEKYLHEIHNDDIDRVVVPALLNLSKSLVNLINDALLHKIRIKSEKHPNGYIYMGNSDTFFNKTAFLVGSMVDFSNFVTVVFSCFWKLLEPSLKSLNNYFVNDFQQSAYNLFDQAISDIEASGDGTRGLVTALTRIKNLTCQKCVVAGGWFQPHSNLTNRVFSLNEVISIAIRASKNIYPRFNASIEVEQSECLDVKLTAVGMGAIVEALSTLFENCWKYSGFSDREYTIDVVPHIELSNGILSFAISNPLSSIRITQLTPMALAAIREKFENNLEFESVASEGGTGLPKIARLSHRVDRSICPVPLDIKLEGRNFVVVAFIPLHKRDEAYDVFNY